MKQLVRVGDTAQGICRAHSSPRQFTATFTSGSSNCTADGLGLVRVGDIGVTDCGHTIRVIDGSDTVTANGIGVARVGDRVEVVEGGEGVIVSGSGTASAA